MTKTNRGPGSRATYVPF